MYVKTGKAASLKATISIMVFSIDGAEQLSAHHFFYVVVSFLFDLFMVAKVKLLF